MSLHVILCTHPTNPGTASLGTHQLQGWNQLTHSPTSCAGISLSVLPFSIIPLCLRKNTGLSILEAAAMIFTLSAQRNHRGLQWANISEKPTLPNTPRQGRSSDMDHTNGWTSSSFIVCSSGCEEGTMSVPELHHSRRGTSLQWHPVGQV